MAYANVFRALGFNPLFPVGRAHSNIITRPTTAPRHASSGGNMSTALALYDAYANKHLTAIKRVLDHEEPEYAS